MRNQASFPELTQINMNPLSLYLYHDHDSFPVWTKSSFLIIIDENEKTTAMSVPQGFSAVMSSGLFNSS